MMVLLKKVDWVVQGDKMRLVFLGPPGAGKGTQAELLKKRYDYNHISTGEVLRQEIQKNTDLGKEVESYVNKGELAPDEIVTKIIKKWLKSLNNKKGIVLDGFPRNLTQAEYLEEDFSVDYVLYFDLEENEIVERLSNRLYCPQCEKFYNLKYNPPQNDNICDKCEKELIKRKDDTPEAIKKRLAVYNKNTHPLVKHYEEKGSLIHIDASKEIDKVFEQVLERIGLEETKI
ncbi:MAG: adenylate kinase [Candidatus Mcinerneyibacterium aminivorans]|jgi:adenylate kinase|uniref:Adenylate kinase n=1 Tax=Candidatus Mcinerneyibacterium aminivorans TaxID=2703815 RepID=A0A5D0MFY7_9BACT|nr:MAG: adenylate kinase [Candidatus Mcinerneyibacterium aminivorans]